MTSTQLACYMVLCATKKSESSSEFLEKIDKMKEEAQDAKFLYDNRPDIFNILVSGRKIKISATLDKKTYSLSELRKYIEDELDMIKGEIK